MKRIIAVLVLAASSQAQAVDCIAMADAFLSVAQAGKGGSAFSDIADGIDKADSQTEASRAQWRMIFLEAYERGQAGESSREIWNDFYGRCKSISAKEERPS